MATGQAGGIEYVGYSAQQGGKALAQGRNGVEASCFLAGPSAFKIWVKPGLAIDVLVEIAGGNHCLVPFA